MFIQKLGNHIYWCKGMHVIAKSFSPKVIFSDLLKPYLQCSYFLLYFSHGSLIFISFDFVFICCSYNFFDVSWYTLIDMFYLYCVILWLWCILFIKFALLETKKNNVRYQIKCGIYSIFFHIASLFYLPIHSGKSAP